jgi:hypothetical protein
MTVLQEDIEMKNRVFTLVVLFLVVILFLTVARSGEAAGLSDGTSADQPETLLNIIFLVGLAIMMTTSDLVLFFKTIPLGTRVLFLLPWISGALTLALPLYLVKLWRQQAAAWLRVRVLLVTLAAFSFSWFVYNWHLYL